jgi:hypothetical protein
LGVVNTADDILRAIQRLPPDEQARVWRGLVRRRQPRDGLGMTALDRIRAEQYIAGTIPFEANGRIRAHARILRRTKRFVRETNLDRE